MPLILELQNSSVNKSALDFVIAKSSAQFSALEFVIAKSSADFFTLYFVIIKSNALLIFCKFRKIYLNYNEQCSKSTTK